MVPRERWPDRLLVKDDASNRMYLAFHGLHERPFTQTPDPRFLYWNEGYREALASLRYGIQQRKGFVALIGEAGTGKTTLLRKLLDDLADEILSVFLFNPNASFEEILEYTLSELGISAPSGRKLAMTQRLNEFLLSAYAEGRNTVLIIDEAQDLSSEVLESLRLLSNLETAQDKILQIVLSGQPELATRLARPELRQLKQRISVRARLEPLSRAELAPYIAARLAVAGAPPDLFAPDSFDAIWSHCGGIPRLINTIGDNALLVAYALGRHSVDAAVISEVAADLAKLDAPGTSPRRVSSSGVIDTRSGAEEPLTALPPPRVEPAAPRAALPPEPEPESPAATARSVPAPEASAAGPTRAADARVSSARGAESGPPNPRLGLAVAGVLATALLLFATVLLQRPETSPTLVSPTTFAGHPGDRGDAVPVPAEGERLKVPPPQAAVAAPPPVPAPDPEPIAPTRPSPPTRLAALPATLPQGGPQRATATTPTRLTDADPAAQPERADPAAGGSPPGHDPAETLQSLPDSIGSVPAHGHSDQQASAALQARSLSAATREALPTEPRENPSSTAPAVVPPNLAMGTSQPTAIRNEDPGPSQTPARSTVITEVSSGEQRPLERVPSPTPLAGSPAVPLPAPAGLESSETQLKAPVPAPRPGDRTITLTQGDTLLDLVGREYGEMSYTALEILRARNPQAMRPEHMIAGSSFVIPAPGAQSRMIGRPESPKVLAVATPILARAMAEQARLAREYGDRVRLETSEVGTALSVYRVVVTDLEPRAAQSLSRRLGPVLVEAAPAVPTQGPPAQE